MHAFDLIYVIRHNYLIYDDSVSYLFRESWIRHICNIVIFFESSIQYQKDMHVCIYTTPLMCVCVFYCVGTVISL